MSFKITARTILHLGAELISSDAVALYELIKNAIDAKSRTGVEIKFEIVIRESDFTSFLATVEHLDSAITLEKLKNELLQHILPDAPRQLRERFEHAIEDAKTIDSLLSRAKDAYRNCNRIVVADEGHGMSKIDLEDVYLTIGTTNRTTAVRQAVKEAVDKTKPPYLGEKGVGRLSVMRLGRMVRIETATKDDLITNVLDIDWNRFEEAYDKPADSVKLAPVAGEPKPAGYSFTRIVISDLRASWSLNRLTDIARDQIARIMDPFSWDERRRFPIKLSFNGEPVEQARTVALDLLKNAHAHCKGRYELIGENPSLTVTFKSSLYNGIETTLTFDFIDLLSMSGLKHSGHPPSFLRSLGPFSFELYWFNRQRLRAIEGIGDREAVRALVKAWSGVSLFRDGYRVLPYGDEGDDWLELDREALASSGYKLNTKQIIGRVSIGRISNAKLLDQTNRQGLTDCPEKNVLVQLLNDIVSQWWRKYLNEASHAQKNEKILEFDTVKETGTVDTLEQRTRESLKAIQKHYSGGDAQLLQQVKDAFLEIKDAHARAVQRINSIEEEKERLTQLAGVGLMIEVIAHELTRATEDTQKTLKTLNKKQTNGEANAAFHLLSQQIKIIQKRLKTLEPLSITARQRRSTMNLEEVIKKILEAHKDQFDRNGIDVRISQHSYHDTTAFIIEGHVIQILENLINNSVYWLDIEKRAHPSFEPRIKISIKNDPPRINYTDNGPGIPPNRVETVFEPFFSTKVTTVARRQGLGLYIARQSAEMLGGTLVLVEEGSIRPGRYNTFELELREKEE